MPTAATSGCSVFSPMRTRASCTPAATRRSTSPSTSAVGSRGASEIVDPGAFAFRHRTVGRPIEEYAIYELHVGSFTPEGSFAAAAAQLARLADLGITAVELMPVGAFPGRRNWGYDGVAWLAP